MKKLGFLILCSIILTVAAVKPAGASSKLTLGSQLYSDVEPAGWPPTIHLRIAPFMIFLHLHIDGHLIHGIAEHPGHYYNQPVLGWIHGPNYYIFIDFTRNIFGGPIPMELAMIVGTIPGGAGHLYATMDGTAIDAGPIAVVLVAAASPSQKVLAEESSFASAPVEPAGWPPTIHFRVSPYIDVLHLHVDGHIIHGIDEAVGFYSDQPVLGWHTGDNLYIACDFTRDDMGLPIFYELALFVGHKSTLMGSGYRTRDGTAWVGPGPIHLVPP